MINKIETKLNGKWDSMMDGLSDNEKGFFNNAKTHVFNAWKFLKPIAIAIFLFGLFTKLRTTVGHDTVIFILLVTIVIYLRLISSKLG